MFGASTGILRVYLVNVDMNGKQKEKQLVFVRLGPQGFDWERAEVNIHTDSYFMVSCGEYNAFYLCFDWCAVVCASIA